MLLKRILAALIAVPLIYLCLTELPPVCFLILVIIISALAQYEFCSMYKSSKIMTALSLAGGVALLASVYLKTFLETSDKSIPVLAVFIILITLTRLLVIKNPASAFADIAPAIVSILYIPGLLIPVWSLRLDGPEWIILLLACVWSSDTFAFFIGTYFGKRRLYKEISPNKTVAGAVGSVMGGALASLIFGGLLIKDIGLIDLFILGAILGAVTIAGDLVESMFKRDAGVKDSGTIIPGHGGALDRIDSILFAAPTLYFIKTLL